MLIYCQQYVPWWQHEFNIAKGTQNYYLFKGGKDMIKLKRNILFLALILSFVLIPLSATAETDLFEEGHTPYINGFEDGTFRPKENITREQVMSVLASKAMMSPPFAIAFQLVPDVEMDRWSYYAIAKCLKDGMVSALFDISIVNENGSMSFPIKENIYPTKPITRGELLAILFDSRDRFYTEGEGFPELSRSMDFKDISGHRFEKEIIDMANRGIISGYEDNTFQPDNNITRAEFVKVMNAFLDRCDTKQIDDKTNRFSDISEKDWFYYDVIEASVHHSFNELNGNNIWLESLED